MASSAVYGFELPAKSISPFYHGSVASDQSHRFVVGTCSATSDNKIYLLEYQDETKVLECMSVWDHPKEITSIACCPSSTERGLISVVSPHEVTVLQASDSLMSAPKAVHTVKRSVKQVLWDLEGLQSDVRVVYKDRIATVSLSGSKIGEEKSSHPISSGDVEFAVLDPHHGSLCFCACANGDIRVVDFRSKKETRVDRVRPHGFGPITTLDLSQSKPNVLLTGGSDGIVSLYDIRVGTGYELSCLNYIKAHEHTVNKALMNPFHDDLMISGSSDQTVKLWDSLKAPEPTCLMRLADYGDSVMDVCWSGNGPWVYASVSYNAKVVVDSVPSEKKMGILLDDKK